METLGGADVLMLQLETPAEVSLAAAQHARSIGVRVVWDPAPAVGMPDGAYESLDVLAPNQGEAASLTGIDVTDVDSAGEAADTLLARGVPTVVVKLGEQGVYYAGRSEQGHVPAFRLKAVDTIAAGDAFGAALAVALSEGRGLGDAVRFGAAAGALAVTKRCRPAPRWRRFWTGWADNDGGRPGSEGGDPGPLYRGADGCQQGLHGGLQGLSFRVDHQVVLPDVQRVRLKEPLRYRHPLSPLPARPGYIPRDQHVEGRCEEVSKVAVQHDVALQRRFGDHASQGGEIALSGEVIVLSGGPDLRSDDFRPVEGVLDVGVPFERSYDVAKDLSPG